MPRHRNLVLAHLWLAFAVFAVATVFGVWQMWVRSPLHAPNENPHNYFLSVTAHGVSMGYVLTTFFVMGFGYFVAETALRQAIPWIEGAWIGFWVAAAGAVMAALTILSGGASVLYTFYPPLTASPFFYIGLVMVVVGSWIWCAIMIAAMARWKRANPRQAVPLAMFSTVANAIMWLWTTAGVAVRAVVPGNPRGDRVDRYRRCWNVAHLVFLDLARDRLFLAASRLYRLLHDGTRSGRRAAL